MRYTYTNHTKELRKFLNKNDEGLAGGIARTARLVDPALYVGSKGSVDLLSHFFEGACRLPCKGNMDYVQRVQAWLKKASKETPVICFILTKKPGVGDLVMEAVRVVALKAVSGLFIGLEYIDEMGKEVSNWVEVSHIFPIFENYYPVGTMRSLMAHFMDNTQEVFCREEDFKTLEIEYPFSIGTAYVDISVLNQHTIKSSNQEVNIMTKTQKFLNTEKASFSLAAKVAAGNATNAVVKAALRPVLVPLLAKTLAPKGRVQRLFASNKVEESVDAILASPFMDVFAAAILVATTSSGLVKNEKLVEGASLASDAAAIKLQSMIDFDAIVSAITEKVGTVVDSLDNVDTTK